MHVIDISHPNSLNHAEAVYKTLQEIGADQIPSISVLNKIDLLQNPEFASEVIKDFPRAVAISALMGSGISDLLERVHSELFENYSPISVFLPYKQGHLISLFHERGQIESSEYKENNLPGLLIKGKIPRHLYSEFKPWIVKKK